MSIIIKKEKTETALTETKQSPSDTIDLTIESDDEDEDLMDFAKDLTALKDDVDIFTAPILKMFAKKHADGEEVLDEFINWGEKHELASETMKAVADALNIKYEDYGGQVVWEEETTKK